MEDGGWRGDPPPPPRVSVIGSLPGCWLGLGRVYKARGTRDPALLATKKRQGKMSKT